MLLTLLCLYQVSAEWVEISQTYRKPLSPVKSVTTVYHPFSTITTSTVTALVPTTKKSELFNQLLTDKHWSKGSVIRVPHVGTVKRVHADAVRNKTKITPSESNRPIFKDSTQNHDNNGDKLSIKLNLFERNNLTQSTEENYNVKFHGTSIKRNPFLNVGHSNTNPVSQFPNIDQLTENISQIDEERNEMGFIKSEFSEDSIKFSEPKPNKLNSNIPYQTDYEKNHDVKLENVEVTHLPTFQFVTQIENIKDSSESYASVLESDESKNSNRENSELTHASSVVKKNATDRKTIDRKPDTNSNERNLTPNDQSPPPGADNPKVNTMESVIKILKLVSKTIAQNTKQSFGSKIKYLHNLKNTIMANIESSIDRAWPEDGRRARSLAAARSHVDFPSSESALMTISFLTFAVFLIKLVLQVIQKYKNTSMMTNAVLAAVQRAAPRTRAGEPAPAPAPAFDD